MTEQKTHGTLYSMPALYRQYRPTTFAEIMGQGHITSILTNEIEKGAIAHAYLFQGPRGTGKTTTARVFAKRINCTKAKGSESCGKCASCTAFQEGRALDIIEIDAASNRGIDDIRALRETVSLSPTLGTYKVYIIDEVHQLSGPAFAALLKTLEEPPKHVLFILATTELQKVPATIVSRCQLFRFRRATADEMRERITHLLSEEKREADDSLISFIIARSDGCYRDAESLLGQLLSQKEGIITADDASTLLGIPSSDVIEQFLSALISHNTAEAVNIATRAYTDGFDPEQFLQESIRAAREQVIQAVITGSGPIDRLTSIMRAFLVATQDLAYVPEPLIALELAILTATASTTKRVAAPQSIPPRAQPVALVQHVSSPAPSDSTDERLQTIRSSWEAVIQNVRTVNPVASTFLRATRPHAMKEDTLILHMQFPLHKTFFEKPANQKVVQEAISTITTLHVRVGCLLEPLSSTPSTARQSQETDLLKNVQEVFGVQVG